MVLALGSAETSFWGVYLIIGAIVILAVAVLLSLLLSLVRSIESNVQRLQAVAQGVAGNTENIKSALAVVASLDEVIDELRRHAQLLGVESR
jgi:energy-converting hydrogenase Eha subunit H